jgi:hypothetical protein
MADEIEQAVVELEKARNAGAKPLVFSQEATTAQNERSRGQLRATLPSIKGGWTTVKGPITRAAGLVGTVSKEIAHFQNDKATEINAEQASMAREVAEHACKLTLSASLGRAPSVAEGWVCG